MKTLRHNEVWVPLKKQLLQFKSPHYLRTYKHAIWNLWSHIWSYIPHVFKLEGNNAQNWDCPYLSYFEMVLWKQHHTVTTQIAPSEHMLRFCQILEGDKPWEQQLENWQYLREKRKGNETFWNLMPPTVQLSPNVCQIFIEKKTNLFFFWLIL